MSNMAIQSQLAVIVQKYGVVTQVEPTMTVQVDTGYYQAECAASCLLEPMPGDSVLLVTDTNQAHFVLAVLARANHLGAMLRLPANTEIQAADGHLKLSARDGIALQTVGELSMQSATLRVEALKGDVTVQSLSLVGGVLRSCVDQIKSVGRTFDSVFERCHQRVGRSYRVVDEIDQVKANMMDYRADTSLQLHARHTLMTADELVKVDADQIHLG